MKKHSFNTIALTLAGFLLIPLGAQAHGSWLAKIHGEHTVMYGHHESMTDPYDPAKIVDARAFKNGQKAAVKIVPHEQRYATLETDNPGLLGCVMDNGLWVQTKDGKWHNKPKDAFNASEVTLAQHSYKYAVSYLNDREPVNALGYDLEIVPAVNPAKLKKGDKLSVQVLFKGKPLPEAKLNSNFFGDGEKLTTNAEGRAEVSIARDGFNTLSVGHATEQSGDKAKADKVSMSSSLSFRTHKEQKK